MDLLGSTYLRKPISEESPTMIAHIVEKLNNSPRKKKQFTKSIDCMREKTSLAFAYGIRNYSAIRCINHY